MCQEQIKAIFKKFDKYACVKNDQWYKDYKKELGVNYDN